MVNVRSFVFSPFSENTYVLSDETREAVVIDPGCYTQAEKEELRDYIRGEELTVKAILLTHAHLDHVFGAAYIARTFGVEIYMHPLEKPILADFETRCRLWGIPGCEPVEAQHYFEEGDTFSFGNTVLHILHVPGHAPGHVAFTCEPEKWVISGDCLFHRSIGRTDLPMGDYNTLIHSIRTKLFLLPDDFTVYAGHMQPTTIGEEKKLNPFLQS